MPCKILKPVHHENEDLHNIFFVMKKFQNSFFSKYPYEQACICEYREIELEIQKSVKNHFYGMQ